VASWPAFAELGDVPEEFGYYIYELWSDDVCLYVGRVGNNGPGSVRRRFKGHATDKSKSWWPQVTRVVVSRFASHEEIVAEEPRRIQELRPVHNRQYAWLAKADVSVPSDTGEREDSYQAVYRQQPVRKQQERARETGHARRTYYNSRNSLPEVKARKRRWALRTSRRPGPGQAGLF
jgi:hypothetical protein